MKEFNKRTYQNFSDFFNDLKFILKNLKQIKKLDNGEYIDEKFKERLMLAVTAVNGCRYCSFYHTRLALKTGITSQELDQLLNGSLKNSPAEEKMALLYAEHWVEQNRKADKSFEEKLKDNYGDEKATSIKLAIRTINFGNLIGNTLDYFLFKLTFGHLGAS